MKTIKKAISFFTDRPIYSFGCGVSLCLFWLAHGPKMEGWIELAIFAVFSVIVTAFSWCYPVAKLINIISIYVNGCV